MRATAGFRTGFRRLRSLAAPCEDSRVVPAVTLSQRVLAESYRQRLVTGGPPIRFQDTGFSVFSQNEEDGLLLYLFTLLGTTNRIAVEICAGDGVECNTANLFIHHGWTGALFDGRKENIERGTDFYRSQHNTRIWPPKLLNAWITRENVDQLIEAAGTVGEVDLLSLDIDGNDYWVWDALTVIVPRVVVLEFNHLWGPDEAVTIPYDPNFVATFTQYGSDYAGASLAAFVAVGRRKGYHLVGTNAFGTNAFFIQDGITHPWLPEVSPQSCFTHPRARFGISHRLPGVRDREWQRV